MKFRPNPHAARIARAGIEIQVGRGRPKKLPEVGETEPRSVRFPPAVARREEARLVVVRGHREWRKWPPGLSDHHTKDRRSH
jgi:hypothetical protein